MSLFCCYAKQDIVDPEVTNALTKEADKTQDPPIEEPLVTEETPIISEEPLAIQTEEDAEDEDEDEEVARINERAVEQAIKEKEEEHDQEQPPLEYRRIIYDSVTNTMEEIVVKILSEDIVEPEDTNNPAEK